MSIDLADYLRLRAFAFDVLGDRLPARPDPDADFERAVSLAAQSSLRPAELAAAQLVASVASMFPFRSPAGVDVQPLGPPTPAELSRLQDVAREAASALAAHVPERDAAELARIVNELLPQASTAPEAATVWTGARKTEARAMRDRLKREGCKDFARRTAAHYRISTSRLRDVLKEDATPARVATPVRRAR